MGDRLVGIDTDKARGDRMAVEVQDEILAILLGLSGGGVPAALNAAGVVMNTDTTTVDMQFVNDSEDFTDPEDIDRKLATRRAVRKWIETRLQAYAQPVDEDLTAFAALALGADRLPYSAGGHTWAATDLTPVGRTIIGALTNAAVRSLIGARALDPRVLPVVTSSTPMAGWNWDAHDELVISGLDTTVTTMTPVAPAGTAPTSTRPWVALFKDNGTSQTITAWGSWYRFIGVPAPTATIAGKYMWVAGKWVPSDGTGKIHVLSVQQET
jgi:hypothetical protein